MHFYRKSVLATEQLRFKNVLISCLYLDWVNNLGIIGDNLEDKIGINADMGPKNIPLTIY